jgi:hypothetical protein
LRARRLWDGTLTLPAPPSRTAHRPPPPPPSSA